MNCSDFLISSDVSLLDAMKIMDRNTKGIVYLCEGRKLLGALTDGDVRRFMMNGGSLKDSVWKAANRDPKYVFCENRKQADRLMNTYKIRSLPIVNEQYEIEEIRFLSDTIQLEKAQLGIPVVIMAGGKGTRLYPYTQILPKPLIPIGEKTITEHIMDRFQEYGCTHFDMIVNYKKNFIKSYFIDNENSRDVSFVEEKEFLGTGGGLKLLEGRYSSTFFMSNCDILIEADYADVLQLHREQGNIATMVCAVKRVVIPYGTVDVAEGGQAVRLNEKPEFNFITNTGFYLLEPEFLDEIPENTFIHITDVLQKCIDRGKKIGVYPIKEEKWLDMGQLDELERMKKRLKEG